MTRVRATARGELEEFRTEAPFQAHVVMLARGAGWGITKGDDERRDKDLAAYGQLPDPLEGLIFHPRIMYRSEPGWPDLTLIRRRDRRLLFAELKTDKKDSVLSPRQAKVLDLLRAFASDRPVLCASERDDPAHPVVDRAAVAGASGLAAAMTAIAAARCQSCPPWIQVRVWRPSNLPEIVELLR